LFNKRKLSKPVTAIGKVEIAGAGFGTSWNKGVQVMKAYIPHCLNVPSRITGPSTPAVEFDGLISTRVSGRSVAAVGM